MTNCVLLPLPRRLAAEDLRLSVRQRATLLDDGADQRGVAAGQILLEAPPVLVPEVLVRASWKDHAGPALVYARDFPRQD